MKKSLSKSEIVKVTGYGERIRRAIWLRQSQTGGRLPDGGRPKTPITGPPFKRLNHAGRVTWRELERFASAIKEAAAAVR